MSTYVKKTLEPRIVNEMQRIKAFKNKKFCSRHEIMEEINFPPTNPARIVVKSNEKGTGFMRNHYHEEYCRNYISKKDFDTTVDKVSLIIGNEYSRKRKLDTQGMTNWTKILLGIALIQMFFFSILALAYHWSEANRSILITTIAVAIFGFAIGLAILLYNFCRPYEETLTFEQMVFRKVSEYLSSANDTYRNQNIEWVLVPYHYWMEVRMMDKNERDYDNPNNEQSRHEYQNSINDPNNNSNLLQDEEESDEEEEE
jgi:hypothetical protein